MHTAGEDRIHLETTGFSCHSDLYSEVCLANKPVIIDKNALTVYIPSNQAQDEHKVQPYARKEDQSTAMKAVTRVKILVFHQLAILLTKSQLHFQSRLQFVITDFKCWWVSKYDRILSTLSSYDVINPVENGSVHCHPGAVIGSTVPKRIIHAENEGCIGSDE
ncbi:protein O-linked-mannose beta-1 4-N-acetylglucosaminyltransferase 2-like [Prunus yedoensis var. nudiflora]|uniref:Protein O-linked-mannose beta-1 4-N-acetylglucosaminyltransferase 2-like n=1 Tax=Prunus yedoensis var. nudiflora TaxID=2094558 RepID=A0A314UP03_PRUYE|nr:protein O-linked-mannose beta-1 4-N-acetylglucosaminyltransferase 2-like [Prunus yedoensis var. nudiflora]